MSELKVAKIRMIQAHFDPKLSQAGNTAVAVHARDDDGAVSMHDRWGNCIRIDFHDLPDFLAALGRVQMEVDTWKGRVEV